MSELDSVLKPYTSHKMVSAAEITSVGNYRTDSNGGLVRAITLNHKVTIELPDTMFVRYVPVPGDFLVVYGDGYKSFSPRKAFLDGYKPDGQSFADIKQGLKIKSGQQAGTNDGDGIALTSASHPGDPFKGQE